MTKYKTGKVFDFGFKIIQEILKILRFLLFWCITKFWWITMITAGKLGKLKT